MRSQVILVSSRPQRLGMVGVIGDIQPVTCRDLTTTLHRQTVSECTETTSAYLLSPRGTPQGRRFSCATTSSLVRGYEWVWEIVSEARQLVLGCAGIGQGKRRVLRSEIPAAGMIVNSKRRALHPQIQIVPSVLESHTHDRENPEGVTGMN